MARKATMAATETETGAAVSENATETGAAVSENATETAAPRKERQVSDFSESDPARAVFSVTVSPLAAALALGVKPIGVEVTRLSKGAYVAKAAINAALPGILTESKVCSKAGTAIVNMLRAAGLSPKDWDMGDIEAAEPKLAAVGDNSAGFFWEAEGEAASRLHQLAVAMDAANTSANVTESEAFLSRLVFGDAYNAAMDIFAEAETDAERRKVSKAGWIARALGDLPDLASELTASKNAVTKAAFVASLPRDLVLAYGQRTVSMAEKSFHECKGKFAAMVAERVVPDADKGSRASPSAGELLAATYTQRDALSRMREAAIAKHREAMAAHMRAVEKAMEGGVAVTMKAPEAATTIQSDFLLLATAGAMLPVLAEDASEGDILAAAEAFRANPLGKAVAKAVEGRANAKTAAQEAAEAAEAAAEREAAAAAGASEGAVAAFAMMTSEDAIAHLWRILASHESAPEIAAALVEKAEAMLAEQAA